MKKILLTILITIMSLGVYAQYTINDEKTEKINDSIKIDNDISKRAANKRLDINYYSAALERAKHQAYLRKLHLVEANVGLGVKQTSFGNWAKGGDNTFSGRFTFDIRHVYELEKLKLDSKLEGRYGMNVIDRIPFKNEDVLKFDFKADWSISGNWSYSSTISLATQFAKGYKSRTDKTLKSNFMAPGTIDVGLGLDFTGKKFPLSISLYPVTGKLTCVLDKELQQLGINGVEKGKRSKSQLGSSVKIKYAQAFYHDIFKFTSEFKIFYNYEIPANAQWTPKLEINATRFLSTSLFADFIYDETANTPFGKDENKSHFKRYLQFNYIVGLELKYRFNNRTRYSNRNRR